MLVTGTYGTMGFRSALLIVRLLFYRFGDFFVQTMSLPFRGTVEEWFFPLRFEVHGTR